MKNKINKIVDVDSNHSDLKGFKGKFESILRSFRTTVFFILLAPVYFLAALLMAVSLTPGVYLFRYAYDQSQNLDHYFGYPLIAFSLVAGFFLYGFTLLFIAPLTNKLLPFKLKPFRGPYYSLHSIPWYVHNALIYLVRYTFLEFVTPTPLNILFYKMMGMKIGKGVHINTTNISDACLVELEDKVTIGGSAHIICHYASKGYLVIAPVIIKKGATLGLKSTVMGDVIIGENATIGPHEVVYPKSRVADNTTIQTMEQAISKIERTL
jgi:hypothetical protein